MDSLSEGSLRTENHADRWTGRAISIDMLPDDALLATFDFCVDESQFTEDESDDDSDESDEIEAWQSLVHVCRRWRSVVFASPRRLNLRLLCTSRTTRDKLDVWPTFPLVIWSSVSLSEGIDNILALLKHSDRVCQIRLYEVPSLYLEKIWAAMQVPFPKLTDLRLRSNDKIKTVLPDSFLGRSAPRLDFLMLERIPFRGLPELLLTATHLVHLYLEDIPHSGYISPKSMVTVLSALSSLRYLMLEFESPPSRPGSEGRRLPPPTRSVLPILTSFDFKGDSEYLDDFVAGIDAPRLNFLYMTFFNDIVFDTPQLVQFISRTTTLSALEKAHVTFEDRVARVKLSSQTPGHGILEVRILCENLDWQVSSLEQVCTSCLPPLSMSEDIYICVGRHSRPNWQDNVENTQWLELLHPFTAVKNLYLSEEIAARIAPALRELVGGRDTDVLPTLQNISLEGFLPSGPVQEAIGKFVATRQVTSHPIVVTRWERDDDDDDDDDGWEEEEDR